MPRYIDTNLIEYHPSEDGCMDDTITRYDINEMPDADVVPRADYDKLKAENVELKRRLGAAISDINTINSCRICKKGGRDTGIYLPRCDEFKATKTPHDCDNFEWRGAQSER